MLCLLACPEFGGRFRARIRFLPSLPLRSLLPSAEIDQDDTILEYLLAFKEEEEAAAAIFSGERERGEMPIIRGFPPSCSLRRVVSDACGRFPQKSSVSPNMDSERERGTFFDRDLFWSSLAR